jgi:hypothetical protein
MTRNRLTAMLAVAVGALGVPASAHASYADDVLADDPLTYLRLDETPGATVAKDASPNHRDGVYVGTPALGVDGPFDAAGDAVLLGAGASVTANVAAASGSVELWVNPSRLPRGAQAGIVSHGDPSGDGWAVGIGDKRKLAFVSAGVKVASKVTLSSDVWTMLTVTWSGTKVNLYRNGALAKSLNRGSALPSSSGAQLVLGGNGAGQFTGPFDGRLDEAALYAQALSAADIADHFDVANIPVNTAPPKIDDPAPTVGQTLAVQPGTWLKGGTANYQWQRCDADGTDCEDIVGATGTSYLVGAGEACGTIQVAETMTNAAGSATAVSAPTDPVAGTCGTTVPVNTEPPAIDDLEPAVGDTLNVTAGSWSDIGTATYQWQRCDADGLNCEDIAGENGTAYIVDEDDPCATIRVVETMSNVAGAGSQASDATAQVVCVPVNATPPAIPDTAAVDEELTVEQGAWQDAESLGHQWQRCDAGGGDCVDIADADGGSYVVAEADACATLRVIETATNTSGADQAVSNTAAVAGMCGTTVPANTALPTIDDLEPVVGDTLSVTAGSWSDIGTATHQWQRCDAEGNSCVDIAGANGGSYVVAAADACATLRVAETMTNGTGAGTAVSGTTPKVPGDCDPGTVPGPGTDPGTVPGPGTDPGTAPGTGTGTGTGAGTGSGTDPGTQPAGCVKLLAGRNRVKLRRLGTLRLKAVAGTCITTALRVEFKSRKGAKLQSVRYKLDGKRLKGLKRPRNAARLTASRLPAGSHTLTVRVRPRDGKARSAKLRLRLAVS